MPLFTDLARSLPATVPFVGPETLERRMGQAFRARLGANESVFGPSPAVVEAMARAATESWAYGDPEQYELKRAIAAHHGIGLENIAIGEGIDGLLGHLVHLATDPGDTVVTSYGAYPTFNYHVAGHGAKLDFVPYRPDAHEDAEALVERATALRPKLLYFANPDNPTGSWHDARTIEQMIDAVPEETILVLDEAYSDLAPEGALTPITLMRPNLLRFRTFSKAYGMAGVRVAYVVGEPATVAQFDKVRNHFGVSRIAQAGAIAALKDQAFLVDVVKKIAAARAALADIARRANMTPLASATNFVAIDCGGDGDYARGLLAAVLKRGVFIRMPGVAPLDRMIRVSAGRPDDLALFEDALFSAIDEIGRPNAR
ncbi:pyridoxal phosphate-dependent aminotransferase [Jiella sonneratiae]|uniref:histidinol-phosphate transaminase n=1 Tax=Jiella sonneratiae TaxID=2816856 RepID=A0ABS3J689_9HYPH|nr:pyridoxal phosphate-dependent aminotransferase [Jiella sonneratiae]MBO0904612.1 pyridoxal phosphate-dependent aminotransferase [Jiella sonneratiae]